VQTGKQLDATLGGVLEQDPRDQRGAQFLFSRPESCRQPACLILELTRHASSQRSPGACAMNFE